ncbi:MAG: M42 family peptidase, partial [Clostridiales bacterium]|nr:M42 family peptidase [Clostridiales bacterium]
MNELLKSLINAPGVSGDESCISGRIKELLGKKLPVTEDNMGNLMVFKKGTGPESVKMTIMVAAHMDEIGIVATYIEKNGFIRFAGVGWVSPFFAMGQEVIFKDGTVGSVFYEQDIEKLEDLKLTKMFI